MADPPSPATTPREGDGQAPVSELSRRVFLAAALAILSLAAIVRGISLGRQSVWLDESFSYHIATARDWLGAALLNNSPPLFYLLLEAAVSGLGIEPWALRFTSAAAGVVAVAAAAWWCAELAGRRCGLWAGLLLALSPIHVYYSQEARTYAVLLACLLLALAALTRALAPSARRRGRRRWLPFACLATLAFYSHLLAGLALLSSLWLVWPAGRQPAGGQASDGRPGRLGAGGWPQVTAWLLCLVVALAAFVPWAAASYQARGSEVGGADWVAWAWERTPPALAVPRSLEILALGAEAGQLPVGMKQMTQVALPPPVRWTGLALILGVTLLPLAPRRILAAAPGTRALAFRLWGMLLTPLLALWAVSWWKPLYLVGRYDLIALPPFVALGGLGLARLARGLRPALGRFSAAAALPIAAVLMWKLWLLGSAPPARTDLAATAAAIVESAADDDLVLFTGTRGFPVLYELARLGYPWDDAHCVGEGKSFACRVFSTTWRRGLASDPFDRVLTEDELRSLTGELLAGIRPRRVLVVLGSYRVAGDRLSATRDDLPLLRELERRGFRAAGASPPAGILGFSPRDPG